ncbi:hypothetical protein OIU91_19770 [Streptomyces sp. NBC_01456]|uniref:hypothetical protein n=1 Tax=Streptomyces sp. NBC_01456 TaxID=2975868 RepID=UPI002E37A3F7|nr:hypothetical protein [Streptomyces sp. NBC_01456]
MTSNDAQYDAAVRLLAERPYLVELATHLDRALREYEGSRAEARPATTGGYDEGSAPSLFRLARAHAGSASLDERAEAVEVIGSEMSLSEAGTVRRAAKAIEGALPEIILDARINGQSPTEIARELGFANDSRVYLYLRKHPWQASYLVERHQGGSWVKVDSGLREVFKDSAEQVAVDVAREQAPGDARVRVSVWRAGDPGESVDLGTARYAFERDPAE